MRQLSGREFAPDCEVWIYPDDCSSSRHDRQESDGEPLVSDRSQLDSLFAYPMPIVKRALDVVGSSIGLILVAPSTNAICGGD